MTEAVTRHARIYDRTNWLCDHEALDERACGLKSLPDYSVPRLFGTEICFPHVCAAGHRTYLSKWYPRVTVVEDDDNE